MTKNKSGNIHQITHTNYSTSSTTPHHRDTQTMAYEIMSNLREIKTTLSRYTHQIDVMSKKLDDLYKKVVKPSKIISDDCDLDLDDISDNFDIEVKKTINNADNDKGRIPQFYQQYPSQSYGQYPGPWKPYPPQYQPQYPGQYPPQYPGQQYPGQSYGQYQPQQSYGQYPGQQSAKKN